MVMTPECWHLLPAGDSLTGPDLKGLQRCMLGLLGVNLQWLLFANTFRVVKLQRVWLNIKPMCVLWSSSLLLNVHQQLPIRGIVLPALI